MTQLTFKYRHNKTGRIYHVIPGDVFNATNAQDGQKMVLYRNDVGNMYVRERAEFNEKFTRIQDVASEMHTTRYAYLDKEGRGLTQNEIDAGWHFCLDYDGMLVGPGMQAQENCTCNHPPRRAL